MKTIIQPCGSIQVCAEPHCGVNVWLV